MQALALVALLLIGSAGWANAQTCPLPSDWPAGIDQLVFVGANGICPGAAAATSVSICAQCVCANLGAFRPAYLAEAENLTTYPVLNDFIKTCLNLKANEFSDVNATEEGVAACLSDSAFQADVGEASNIGPYCIARFANSPPPGTATGTYPPPAATPSPPTSDAIPPAPEPTSFEGSAEESSGEFLFPPSPPPPYGVPPAYPPSYPPPVPAPRPPSPGSGATLPAASLALQAAVAVVVLLASVMLF